ncbi:MAG: multicopper oxidase family protein [Hyphomicrobiaceae bacterium]
MITRRQILAGTASIMMPAPIASRSFAAGEKIRDLVAKTGEEQLLPAGEPSTPIWGYDGQVPGPSLRAKQGEEFAVDLINKLPQPTTIHWHGVRIVNAMDGVAGLTQPAVKTGERFSYRFAPPDAGTYWYHPHNRTWEQLARGLQGAFIVEEEDAPIVDQDFVLAVDDWRLREDGQIHSSSFGSMHDMSHAGRLGNVLTLNARDKFDSRVLAGERVRFRLINTATARVLGIIFEGHAPVVVALDGQPLASPFAPAKNMVFLAPAQRADIILDCNHTPGTVTPIVADTGRERLAIGRLVYHASKRARAVVPSDIPILPANPMPVDLDLENAIDITLEMTGGAMSIFKSATYKGKTMDAGELVRTHRKAWAFNGVVGMPDAPLATLDRNSTVTVNLVNRTAWPHAMHFHGHHVREIAHSARNPRPYWRDTVFVQRQQEIRVAFKAHNPGKWMLHCHMLGHQASGMSTWYEVT